MAQPASLTREGTMQITAQEGINFLHQQRADTLLEAQGLIPPRDPPAPARESTMVATAKEGEAFLARVRDQDRPSEQEAPEPVSRLPRESTMAVTASEQPPMPESDSDNTAPVNGTDSATEVEPIPPRPEQPHPQAKLGSIGVSGKARLPTPAPAELSMTTKNPSEAEEGKAFLDSVGFRGSADADTKEAKEIPANVPASAAPSDKPALPRPGTMAVTAKEGERLLSGMGGAPDQDAQTRQQQQQIEAITKKPPAPLAKGLTMKATAKEAAGLLAGEKLEPTRAKSKQKQSQPGLRKTKTMETMLEEAKKLLGAEADTREGRQLRKRAARPEPVVKPPPVKKGTRGRPRKAPPADSS